MNKRFLVIMIIALVALTSGASALNVSFADPDATSHKDIYVYSAAGVLQGVYNTTSSNVLIVGDSLVVLKPQYSNPLDNPSDWLSSLVSWVSTNATTLFLIGVIGFLFFRKS